MPLKLKGNFYWTATRLTMLYGMENKISIEMRMLLWMCGKTRLDRIRNVNFRERERV